MGRITVVWGTLALMFTANTFAENLFFIKRSKNANEVHYDARIAGCAWDHESPVDHYWRDLAVGPDVYSPVRFFEGPAYGLKTQRHSDTEVSIRLKALPDRPVEARLERGTDGECRVIPTTEIDGREATLSSVYVYATEGVLWPRVHYVDILGYNESGEPVYERIARTRKGERMTDPPDPTHWHSGAPQMGRPDP